MVLGDEIIIIQAAPPVLFKNKLFVKAHICAVQVIYENNFYTLYKIILNNQQLPLRLKKETICFFKGHIFVQFETVSYLQKQLKYNTCIQN